MENKLKYGLIIVCSLVGMIIGMSFDDKLEGENVSCQIVNSRHGADTIWVKDTVIKEVVKIKWRIRRVCCCDSICCSSRRQYE